MMKDLTNVTLETILTGFTLKGEENIGAVGTSYMNNNSCERDLLSMTKLSKKFMVLTL